ncbi:MAG: hypothetical protein AAGH15_06300 [Myxococcota bacterium]
MLRFVAAAALCSLLTSGCYRSLVACEEAGCEVDLGARVDLRFVVPERGPELGARFAVAFRIEGGATGEAERVGPGALTFEDVELGPDPRASVSFRALDLDCTAVDDATRRWCGYGYWNRPLASIGRIEEAGAVTTVVVAPPLLPDEVRVPPRPERRRLEIVVENRELVSTESPQVTVVVEGMSEPFIRSADSLELGLFVDDPRWVMLLADGAFGDDLYAFRSLAGPEARAERVVIDLLRDAAAENVESPALRGPLGDPPGTADCDQLLYVEGRDGAAQYLGREPGARLPDAGCPLGFGFPLPESPVELFFLARAFWEDGSFVLRAASAERWSRRATLPPFEAPLPPGEPSPFFPDVASLSDALVEVPEGAVRLVQDYEADVPLTAPPPVPFGGVAPLAIGGRLRVEHWQPSRVAMPTDHARTWVRVDPAGFGG